MQIRLLLRRVRLIVVAVMIGISNVVYEKDKMIQDYLPQTEQEQKDVNLNKINRNG